MSATRLYFSLLYFFLTACRLLVEWMTPFISSRQARSEPALGVGSASAPRFRPGSCVDEAHAATIEGRYLSMAYRSRAGDVHASQTMRRSAARLEVAHHEAVDGAIVILYLSALTIFLHGEDLLLRVGLVRDVDEVLELRRVDLAPARASRAEAPPWRTARDSGRGLGGEQSAETPTSWRFERSTATPGGTGQ